MRIVKPWPRLSREVGDAPSLETIKAMLDWALSNLIKVTMSLFTAGGLVWVASNGPFHLQLFYDSMHCLVGVSQLCLWS